MRWLQDYFLNKRIYSRRGTLELNRQRVADIIKKINALPFEHLTKSPFSNDSGDDSEISIIAMHDRYGIPVRLALCHQTGLLFLVDRLTPEGYNKFYKEGIYRELMVKFWNDTEHMLDHNSDAVKEHAQNYVDALKYQISLSAGATLLDIGGGIGVLAKAFENGFNVKATILDPSQEELKIAESLGLETKLGLIEHVEFADDERYDVIVIHQTLEHVIDIRLLFDKVRTLLEPNGYLIFDIADFIAATEEDGCPEATSRLDHCHFFFEEMIDVLCKRVGVKIEKRIWHDRQGILYICRKTTPDQTAVFSKELRLSVLRKFLTQDVDWKESPLIIRRSRVEPLIFKFRRFWRSLSK